MKLKIHSVEGKGDLNKECIWISVLEDINDLNYYMISDTTYSNEHDVSNELRHLYWFPKKSVKKGDWILLMTKDGANTSLPNKSHTTTHNFYWKLGKTVWNKGGDTAVLFHLNTWEKKNV